MTMSEPDGSQEIPATKESVQHLNRRVTLLFLGVCLFAAAAVVWAVVGSPGTSDDGVTSILLGHVPYGPTELGLRIRPENVDGFIKSSSAIVYCEYQQSGGLLHGHVASVVMLRPGTTLSCSVGDRVLDLVKAVEPGLNQGEGALVFLSGSPAKITDTFPVYDGKILGLDAMRLDELVNKVKLCQPSRSIGRGQPE